MVRKVNSKDRLQVRRVVDVPLREVSGICLRPGHGLRSGRDSHGGSDAAAAISRDFCGRPSDWLHKAAKTAVAAVEADFDEWKS